MLPEFVTTYLDSSTTSPPPLLRRTSCPPRSHRHGGAPPEPCRRATDFVSHQCLDLRGRRLDLRVIPRVPTLVEDAAAASIQVLSFRRASGHLRVEPHLREQCPSSKLSHRSENLRRRIWATESRRPPDLLVAD
ncbi:hypothetical protein M6B38_342695 [Iris pallida]|uniref:Uncharacterized protein n=1 Tax=Iris pallida TaxID=29817 RepID=A0AAX6GW49_IRIPA|nr:hypothetical protein M6B38_342695 [Iris pallida]